MTNRVKRIVQEDLSHVARLSANFCYFETRYYDECNKSSKDYNSEAANASLSRAIDYARKMLNFCDFEGYDIEEIYPECSSFLDTYGNSEN